MNKSLNKSLNTSLRHTPKTSKHSIPAKTASTRRRISTAITKRKAHNQQQPPSPLLFISPQQRSPQHFHTTKTLHARPKANSGPFDDDNDENGQQLAVVSKPKTKRKSISAATITTTPSSGSTQTPSEMTLMLKITDPEVLAFLHGEGYQDQAMNRDEKMQENAAAALKIGVLALKGAQTKVDVHAIHTEVDRMLTVLQSNLSQHNSIVNNHFEERIKRLLQDDGELSVVMKNQLIQTSHILAENLNPLIGPGSKLMTILDPSNKAGLVALVQWAVGEANKSILTEFSLDNKTGSLSRLINELREVSLESTTTNTEYLKELSLDNPQSALNRLINTIESGQKENLKQMSLDNQQSPISRLKLDIVEMLNKQQAQLNSVQELCTKEFSTRSVYDKLSKRTTLFGLDFETKLFSFIQALISGVNPVSYDPNESGGVPVSSYSSSDHIVSRVGNTTGAIRNSKVGDILITLGPEHISAGSKIVIEAKADSSYNIQKALDEITTAKKNRGADVGIFVFAKQSTGGNELNNHSQPIENLKRYGNDVVVVWDPEDPYTNVYLDAALSISKALLIRKQQSAKQTNNTLYELDTNIATMTNIVIDLEKEMVLYDDIRKFAETINSSTEKMLHRLKNSGGRVIHSIEKLNEHIKNQKQLSGSLHQQQLQQQQQQQQQSLPGADLMMGVGQQH